MNDNNNRQPGTISKIFTIVFGVIFMIFWAICWGLGIKSAIGSGQTTSLIIQIVGLLFGEFIVLHSILKTVGTQILGVISIFYGLAAQRRVDRNIRKQAGGYNKHKIDLNKNSNNQNESSDNPYENYGDGSKYM